MTKQIALFLCIVAVLWPLPAAHGQALDTARALSALREAKAACQTDAGALWGRSLCGPIALVDRQTRLVFASDSVTGRRFFPLGDAYVTTLPANQYVANTAFQWQGRAWTMVALPLPQERYARIALLMHEVFHREQPALGLSRPDALNNQLDMRAGRTWLRLEYRALASALEALPNDRATRHHVESALLFRAYRRAQYPGSDSLESTLEIQEGLAEYTGQRLAMRETGEGPARVARFVRDFESTPTFVRAFAYGTGPALGVLLDHFAPDWRKSVATQRDIAVLLAQAIRFQRPRDLPDAARARAKEYGWSEIDAAETARDSARAPAMREYRRRLADGPTLTLRQSKDSLAWSFDPTELIAFDLYSTIYPSGNFSAPWGKLTVEKGGVLVRNDFSSIRLPAPGTSAPPAGSISGEGWILELNPGWSLKADPDRAGSLIVVKKEKAN